MTTEEMISVMQAYLRGETVQFEVLEGLWADIKDPTWDCHRFQYRIKPAELKPREFLIYPKDLMQRGILLPIMAGYRKAIENGMIHVREVLPE